MVVETGKQNISDGEALLFKPMNQTCKVSEPDVDSVTGCVVGVIF